MKFRLSSLVVAMTCQYTLAADPLAQAVQAEDVSAQDFVIEELVVTAQKREQSIQDVPSSVSSVGGDALKSAEITNFQDLEKLTAGLTLDGNRRNAAVSMRGMSTDPDGNARAVVDSYWNNSAVQPGLVFQQMYDIDRIEIMRGAQGTLQGRTSPAGAIAVYTRRPEVNSTDGLVKTSVTDNGNFNTEAAISIPLIEDKLAARVAVNYVEDEAQGIKNTTTGQKQDRDTESARVTLVWQPTDSFDATLIMEYADRKGDLVQSIESVSRGIDPEDRVAISLADTESNRRSKLTNLEMNWDVGNFTLTSVTGYIESESYTSSDLDVANLLPAELPNQVSTDIDSVTQEIRLAPQNADIWDYVLGLYYAKEDAYTTTETGIFTPGVGISTLDFVAPIVREEYAIYLHNIFHVTDYSQVQLGMRYQKIDNFNRMDMGNIAFVSDEQDSDTGEAFTASIKYQYDFSEDVMMYAGIEQSYRPGGISIGLYPLPGEELLYDEETSNSLEIGLKSTLWDGRLQLNGSIYQQEFKDYIARATGIYVNVAPQFGNNPANYKRHSGLTFNADATVTGAEVDFIALLTEKFTLSGSVSYNHAVFEDGETGPCNGLIPNGDYVAKCDIGGNHIGMEPDWSASLSGEYIQPLGDYEGYVRGLYKFTGNRVNDTIDEELGSYGIANLYAGIRPNDFSWEVTLFAKNLFDKVAETTINSYEVGSDVRIVNLEDERTVGVSVSYNFDL